MTVPAVDLVVYSASNFAGSANSDSARLAVAATLLVGGVSKVEID